MVALFYFTPVELSTCVNYVSHIFYIKVWIGVGVTRLETSCSTPFFQSQIRGSAGLSHDDDGLLVRLRHSSVSDAG